MRQVVNNLIFIAQNKLEVPAGNGFRVFSTSEKLRYEPFQDDFGPMNMSCVIRFIELMDRERAAAPLCKIVYVVDEGPRALANAGRY